MGQYIIDISNCIFCNSSLVESIIIEKKFCNNIKCIKSYPESQKIIISKSSVMLQMANFAILCFENYTNIRIQNKIHELSTIKNNISLIPYFSNPDKLFNKINTLLNFQ